MSYETRYAARKRQAQQDRDSSPESERWRSNDRLARLRAKADRDLKYPLIKDADTGFAAIAYFEERYLVHMQEIEGTR